jgi:hypothetical protein
VPQKLSAILGLDHAKLQLAQHGREEGAQTIVVFGKDEVTGMSAARNGGHHGVGAFSSGGSQG